VLTFGFAASRTEAETEIERNALMSGAHSLARVGDFLLRDGAEEAGEFSEEVRQDEGGEGGPDEAAGLL